MGELSGCPLLKLASGMAILRRRGGAAGAPLLGTPPKGGAAQSAAAATSTVRAAAIFTKVATALSQDTFASTGRQVADVTAVRLADGRVRLYAFVNPDGVRSATSTDATGTSFTAEDRKSTRLNSSHG